MHFVANGDKQFRATSGGYTFEADYGLPVDFGEDEMVVSGDVMIEFPRQIDLPKTKQAVKDLMGAMEQMQNDTIADTIDSVPEEWAYSCVYELEIDKDTEFAKQLEAAISESSDKDAWDIEHKKTSTVFSRMQWKDE